MIDCPNDRLLATPMPPFVHMPPVCLTAFPGSTLIVIASGTGGHRHSNLEHPRAATVRLALTVGSQLRPRCADRSLVFYQLQEEFK